MLVPRVHAGKMGFGGAAMPIHDWTRVEPGDFRDLHQVWTVEIRNALNRGLLRLPYFAMAEQITARPIPDVVTLQSRRTAGGTGEVAVKDRPPTARIVQRLEIVAY